MTKNTLLLHVGPHKTGTTAIQKALETSSAALREKGWTFHKFEGHSNGPHSIADRLSASKFDDVKAYLDTLAAVEGNVVVSSENFSRVNEDQAAFMVDQLKTKNIRVVYYLRNPLERISSQWREIVKHGYRYSFVEFLGGRLLKPFADPELNETLKISPWANAVGTENVDLHVYASSEDMTRQFFRTYFPELGESPIAGLKRVNKSFNFAKSDSLRALMGYQTLLHRDPAFQDSFNQICNDLSELCREGGNDYLKTIVFQLNNPIMRKIERTIQSKFGDRISNPASDDMIYETRSVRWEFVNSFVWLAEPEFAHRIFELRNAIHEKYGAPRLDKRLRKL